MCMYVCMYVYMDGCLLRYVLARGLCIGLITSPEKSYRIWHSDERASWYILIIKPTRCTDFSKLFLK